MPALIARSPRCSFRRITIGGVSVWTLALLAACTSPEASPCGVGGRLIDDACVYEGIAAGRDECPNGFPIEHRVPGAIVCTKGESVPRGVCEVLDAACPGDAMVMAQPDAQPDANEPDADADVPDAALGGVGDACRTDDDCAFCLRCDTTRCVQRLDGERDERCGRTECAGRYLYYSGGACRAAMPVDAANRTCRAGACLGDSEICVVEGAIVAPVCAVADCVEQPAPGTCQGLVGPSCIPITSPAHTLATALELGCLWSEGDVDASWSRSIGDDQYAALPDGGDVMHAGQHYASCVTLELDPPTYVADAVVSVKRVSALCNEAPAFDAPDPIVDVFARSPEAPLRRVSSLLLVDITIEDLPAPVQSILDGIVVCKALGTGNGLDVRVERIEVHTCSP